MRCYFAPMEGLTDSIYRQLHHKYFGGVDAYYMPFLSPTMHRTLTAREKRELPAAAAVPFRAVPQILTKIPEDFLWAAEQCALQGYDEVNLNLGCPSGTVVAKGKGAGMLRDTEALDRFLETVFRHTPLPVSVKTRLGLQDASEFPAILTVLNRYPIRELTLHPRVRQQFYKGSVDMDAFRYLLANTALPLCYNGDLCSQADVESFSKEFPSVDAVMIGRGLIGDPGMLTGGTNKEALGNFLAELLECYTEAFGSARNAMFRLKENWHMLLPHFENSEKLGKRLRKTTDAGEYQATVAEILTLNWI